MAAAPISLRSYATRRGVSVMAVSKAIKAGRLVRSVVRDERGQPKIADPELADREWADNTRADRVPLTGPAAKGGEVPPDYAESRARREAAEAGLAELELAKEEGRLVVASEVEARIANDYSKVRTKLLGVPSRVRQQDPALTAAQLALIDTVIREALEDLADGEDVAA